MNAHLATLDFETWEEPVQPKVRTMVHVEAPRGFLEVLQTPKTFPAITFDQLKRDLKHGLKLFAVRRWRDDLRHFQADWHPFIRTERIQCGTIAEELAPVEEAAQLFELPLTVVWVGTITIGLNVDRWKWFPRPASAGT